MIKCGNCEKQCEVKVKETRGFKRYLCSLCKLKYKDTAVICQTKDCRNGINWVKAFAKIKQFSSKNEVYKCMFCLKNKK